MVSTKKQYVTFMKIDTVYFASVALIVKTCYNTGVSKDDDHCLFQIFHSFLIVIDLTSEIILKTSPQHFVEREQSMITLNSKIIYGVDYLNGQLDIFFADGHLIRYFGVPENIFSNLLESKKATAFYDAMIKNEYRSIKLH